MCFYRGPPLLSGRLCGCIRNQVHDDIMAHERLSAPVLSDMAKQPMLDLIPFAGPRRKMAYVQFQSDSVRQFLQGNLPQSASHSVASTTIGGDHQLSCARKPLHPHPHPPATNGLGSETRRVMVDANAHPTLVVRNVVDTIGDGFTQILVLKVMNANLFRVSLETPFSTAVLELAHQFLLFRVHRDYRLTLPLQPKHFLIDIFELRIAVSVRPSFPGLPVCLQAITGVTQQGGNC